MGSIPTAAQQLATDVSSQVPQQGPLSSPEDTSKVHYGVTRDDNSGALVQDRGEFTPGPGGGVMATLRNCLGGQKIDSTSTVEVGGMRTSLHVAEQLGFVREVSPGRWEDVAHAQSQQPQQQGTEQQANPDAAFCDRATESEFERAAADIPAHAVEPALAGAANAVLDESADGWTSVAENLARSTGMELDAAIDLVEQGYEVLEARVGRLAASSGIAGAEKEALYDWARQQKPQGLQRAVNQLTLEGSLAGFRGLISAYKTRAKS